VLLRQNPTRTNKMTPSQKLINNNSMQERTNKLTLLNN